VRPFMLPRLSPGLADRASASALESAEVEAWAVWPGFPLGPREVYVPSYHVSRAYVTRVNVSNTTVNTHGCEQLLQHGRRQQKCHEYQICEPDRD